MLMFLEIVQHFSQFFLVLVLDTICLRQRQSLSAVRGIDHYRILVMMHAAGGGMQFWYVLLQYS